MKRTRFIYGILGAILMLASGSCADNVEVFDTIDDVETGGDVSVTLSFTDFEIEEINSRSAELPSGYGYSLYVIYYNSAGNQLSYSAVSLGSPTADNDYKVTLNNVPAGTSSIHFFHGNSTTLSFYAYSSLNTLEKVKWFNTDSWSVSTPSGGPFSQVTWGAAKMTDLMKPGFKVSMLASYARVTVEKAATAADFTMESFGVYKTAIRGYWTTESLSSENVPATPRLTTIPGYSFGMNNSDPMESMMKTSGYIPVFDSAKGNGRIIIKGSYKGKTGYYVARFARRTPGHDTPSSDEHPSEDPGNYTYQDIDIVRNHQYTLVVEYVRAEGWSTLAEALNAEPDNRITVMIEDRNATIKDIIACRDYAMGVTSNELTVKGDASTVEFDVVATYNYSAKPRPQITDCEVAGTADCAWIETDRATQTLQPGSYAMDGTKGYCYHVSVPLKAYSDDKNSRTGIIKVRTGDLERTITVTQEPRDYIHENSRKIVMRIYDSSSTYASPIFETDDYFAWISQTNPSDCCYGVRPVDNRGAVRDNGLIFPPFSGLYADHIEYWIPYQYGDKWSLTYGYDAVSGTADSYYIGNQRYWRVKQSATPSDITVNKSIELTNGDLSITYPIYQVGFFHELTQSMLDNYAGGKLPDAGWYYYELVKVDDGSAGSDYSILDRNVGATCNSPYISTYLGYSNNSGAVGGYFQAATARFTTGDYSGNYWERFNYNQSGAADMAQKLGFKAFHTPSLYELQLWNVQAGQPSTGVSGTSSYVASVNVLSTTVKDNMVFIPHGGYYEANQHQLSTRANIWTSTIYCQAQGFHPNQSSFPNKNFGFWFYYLDGQPVSGHIADFNQIRCTDATTDNFGDAASYRYMPLRLVFGTTPLNPGNSWQP